MLQSHFNKAATLLNRESRCFPVKREIFKTTYFEEHLQTTASNWNVVIWVSMSKVLLLIDPDSM